jgi:rhamnose utilization protein RhaD (predicted bifunctional aldolase and dehydrogenase)/NAD(P)-dependent dehydrogenase (short-subunit alcohol dehydrogenase family)
MRNAWSDSEAEAAVRRHAAQGIGRDLALRTYSTRLLGSEPRLVIHGGGNTSVKTTQLDVTGDPVEVLCVKGSGWDMATIEPAGLPAVRLQPLQRLADLDALSDEAMVNAQRINLLDATAPNPSVEALLHAFLPHRYIDHTHANAVLALTDQPDGEARCRDLYGETMALVPYIMPGFRLAKAALAIWRDHPEVEGLILLKHGIFTFGDSARQAYDRMIHKVTLAEEAIARGPRQALVPASLPAAMAGVAEVAPILRGLAALDEGEGDWRRWILDFRGDARVLDFVNGRDVGRYSQRGTVTPDHVLRTKAKPLIVPPPDADGLDRFAAAAAAAMAAYKTEYQDYFARNNARQTTPKTPLDPAPRVILVPGLGLFGLGASAAAAAAAADLAVTNVDVITAAEAIGTYEVIGEADIFDIEYWSLEQAKLGKAVEKPLARHVVIVTGGASGIGAATAQAFRAEGAEVAVLDVDGGAAMDTAARLGCTGIGCDVTDSAAVQNAFDRVIATFGGLDIVVSNAGAAWQGRIGEVADDVLRRSFELNFWAHQTVARHAIAVMRAQRTGGCLLFNVSKQAVNPGPGFGPYGLPKAATLALMRQYAVDYGADGIRVGAVNADRIRSGLLTDAMIGERARARGVDERAYMSGNLLGREVTAADVARAFVHLALSRRSTGAVLTVDGGNIAAALR